MPERKPAELVVGAVQLGLAYGRANRSGKPSRAAALRLVRRAADKGVRSFDTARGYGDSENRLGEALAGRRVRTITKLSSLGELASDAPRAAVRAAVDRSIVASLDALKKSELDCLLLHRAAHFTAFGGAIWQRLTEHVAQGTVRALGVSVQNPRETLDALSRREVQHIQLPFNILDWRWREAGIIAALEQRVDVTIHARSVFLQGLLAAGDPGCWPNIDGVDARGLLAWLDEIAAAFGREDRADLCLAYARGQSWIDGIVVGMETEAQLETNLGLVARAPLAPEECARIDGVAPRVPDMLLDPAQWPHA